MRERLHILLGEARALPALDPGPGLHVGNAVLALAVAGEVLARGARVLARELDLEHAVDAQSLVAEAVDGVGDLLGRGAAEVVYLACGGSGLVAGWWGFLSDFFFWILPW